MKFKHFFPNFVSHLFFVVSNIMYNVLHMQNRIDRLDWLVTNRVFANWIVATFLRGVVAGACGDVSLLVGQ